MGDSFTLQRLIRDLGVQGPIEGAEDIALTGVAIDSRTVTPGALFVALPGERTDGHRYVQEAFARGARAALVSKPVQVGPLLDLRTMPLPQRVTAPVAILVDDTLGALQRLAQARREAHPALRVIGVTGSVGKTTAKEAIAAVLAQRFAVLKSEGNQNNEIGLPLTLLGLDDRHERAVLEMAMYALGEIATLCRIAQPQVGVVTNVGPVHLQRLGTLERIARAKAELVEALPHGGTAILNGDDPLVMAMKPREGVQIVTFGLKPENQVRAATVKSHALQGVEALVSVRGLEGGEGQHRLMLPTLGTHSVEAALAAVAVGLSEGLSWDEVAGGLEGQDYGTRLVAREGIRGTTVLDDSYNACPASMLAALDLLGEVGGRRVAILGDMLELGSYEEQGHREVGARCASGVDLLVTVGPLAETIAEAALDEGLPAEAVYTVADAEEAVKVAHHLIQEGDCILVKGSRAVGLERVVSALTENGG